MAVLEYDDEATQRLLALYVTPDVAAQRNDFLQAFAPLPGERVVDVGAGPGFLTTEIAKAVGKSGSVCGVDISEPLLRVARSQSKDQYGIEFRHGDATHLPYPDEAFDVVVSTQVLEYVPDVDAALAEFNRVLRVGGRVALLDTDWDSVVWHSSDRARMSRILTAWEEHAAHAFLPRTLAKRLKRADFQVETQNIIPLFNAEFDPNTYSNRLIDLIIPFVVGRGNITHDEAEIWARELRDCGEDGEYFFSLNRYFFLARKL
ncbi:MAG: methyltransferase domain-containing protein [Gemmatimonadales bacterium]|nr:methyltransferase domain-containing protein [Gemmatimonadales bacterium]